MYINILIISINSLAQGATPFGPIHWTARLNRSLCLALLRSPWLSLVLQPCAMEERRQIVEKYEAILIFYQSELQKITSEPIPVDKLKGQMVEAVQRLHKIETTQNNRTKIDEATAKELIQRLGAITELPDEVNIPDLFTKYPEDFALVGQVLTEIDDDAGEGEGEKHDVTIERIGGVPFVLELVKESD